MAGIGGCVAESSFSFVFLLNRTGTFFLSCSLMVLLTMFLKWPPILLHGGRNFEKVYCCCPCFTVAICLYVSKGSGFRFTAYFRACKAGCPETGYPEAGHPEAGHQKPDTQKPGLKTDSLKTASPGSEPSYRQAKSMYLALYIFVSYFSVRIIGFIHQPLIILKIGQHGAEP